MNTRFTGLLTATLLAAAGCDSSSNNAGFVPPPFEPPAGQARVQALHASPDAPAVNIIGLTPAAIEGVNYKTGSAALSLTEGTYAGVQIDGILPDGSAATVIGPVDLEFDADVLYSIIAIGDDLAIEPLILTQPDTEVPAGDTRLRVVHAAPNAPEVSVFLTAPNADLATQTPVATFAFGADAGPVEVPAGGPYQIRVTTVTAFDPLSVVFDSGELSLDDGADLLIAAVENTTSADGINEEDSPISLVVLDGSGSSEILDTGAQAELRVVHASADTPAVDIIVNDDLANPLVPGLSYPDFAPAPTGFVEVPAASYDISVVDSATQTAEPIDIDGLALAAGVTYDVIAYNEFAAVDVLLEADDYRRLETAAKVRLIHASTVADAVSPEGVDVYVTAPGTDLSTVEPTLDNFEYGVNTGFLELTPGDYEVTVTADGSTDPAIPTTPISIAANGIYTAVARDPRPDVPNDGLGLILLDDFNAQ